MQQTTDLNKIKNSLENGNLCILPTDTILGIFADATQEKAVEKIFTAKKRSYAKPLAIFLPNVEAISKYAIETEASRTFVKKNLPGAYTILLHANEFAKNNLSPLLISQSGTIGIRIPKQDDLIKLMEEVVCCGTSVNITGKEFAKEAIPDEIIEYIDLLYKSNLKMSQTPSAIVDFTQEKPITIVR